MRLDVDAVARVEHPARDAVFACRAIDERAHAYALHNAGDVDVNVPALHMRPA